MPRRILRSKDRKQRIFRSKDRKQRKSLPLGSRVSEAPVSAPKREESPSPSPKIPKVQPSPFTPDEVLDIGKRLASHMGFGDKENTKPLRSTMLKPLERSYTKLQETLGPLFSSSDAPVSDAGAPAEMMPASLGNASVPPLPTGGAVGGAEAAIAMPPPPSTVLL